MKNNMRKLISLHASGALTLIRDFKYYTKFNKSYSDQLKTKLIQTAIKLDTTTKEERSEKPAPLEIGTSKSHAILEINNTCNIDCLMCKTSMATRKKGRITSENLVLMLDRLKEDGVETVALHTIGDPLANPKLPEVFEELRKRDMRAGISTNGLLLHRFVKMFKEYKDVCSLIRFSIDGARKETYERIRVGGKWEDLIENMNIARSQLASDGITIETNMTVSYDNLGEVGEFIELFREYVRHPARDMSFNVINSLSPDTKYFDKVNLFPDYTYHNSSCSFMSATTVFGHVDGEFSLCCRDYDGSLRIGDLRESSVEEVRRGQKLKDIRSKYYSGDYSELPLCASCYVVDGNVGSLFSNFIKYLLMKHPDAKAHEYQQKVDHLVRSINNKEPLEPNLNQMLS